MPAQFPILLVDDDPYVADILNRVASTVFPEAFFIAIDNFTQAVAYLDGLEGIGPRLILLDIDLQSAMTGLDFLTLVRNHPQGRIVPVIVLSGDRSQQAAHEAYSLGANVYTPKPFDLQGWKSYVDELKRYWYKTATIPQQRFGRTLGSE